MKHFRYLQAGLCLAVLGLCAGCSDSDYRGSASQPAAPDNANFNNFVIAQFVAGPSETAAPIEVDATQFTFPADSDPSAFDFVISSAP